MQSIKTVLASMDFTSPAPALLVAVFFCVVIGACVVVRAQYRRWRRRQWARGQNDIRALKSLSWQKFEILAAEAFRANGWGVTETGGGGADNGLDLLLQRGGRCWVAQCKHYKSRVGAPVVREMVGVAVDRKAAGVVVIALNGFTKSAREFAAGKPIHLIDGPALLRMLQKSKGRKSL